MTEVPQGSGGRYYETTIHGRLRETTSSPSHKVRVSLRDHRRLVTAKHRTYTRSSLSRHRTTFDVHILRDHYHFKRALVRETITLPPLQTFVFPLREERCSVFLPTGRRGLFQIPF